MEFKYLKLEIFIPESYLSQLQAALQKVDAGHIGNFDSCISVSRVIGTWRSLEGADPFIGYVGKISEEDELKVEVRIASEKMKETISAVKAVHPYEEPVIHVIPLVNME